MAGIVYPVWKFGEADQVEVDWDGHIGWEWIPAEHFEEFGHSEAAKQAIMNWCRNQHGVFLNTASYVGPNKWYDLGDERFHPDNIITDDRDTMVFIISKHTGHSVWKIGPEFTATPALRALEPLIGPHHAHIIPQGLPGEGNILVFDNVRLASESRSMVCCVMDKLECPASCCTSG